MGAALTVALSLALFFTLLSVLLADLLCSLLRCRKHRFETADPNTSDAAAAAAAEEEEDPHTPPLSFPFYAHGVLQAPTTFLLTIPKLEAATAAAMAAAAAAAAAKKVECKSRMTFTVGNESPSVPTSPCMHRISSASVNSAVPDDVVCISNPIYDRIGGRDDMGTPFETPDASPSHLGPEEETESDYSPQLTAMKKLHSLTPPQALSAVGFMDGRAAVPSTSVSATETHTVSFSSSSYSPCCSPSW